MLPVLHETPLGTYHHGRSDEALRGPFGDELRGRVQLLITSPPFPLNHKKSYDNLQGAAYLEWLTSLAPLFAGLLTPDGSLVVEMGNAWEPGRPAQSLLPLKSLLALAEHPEAGLRLCQEFVCYNPARFPSPAQWVTVERQRVTDSYTHVWWLAKTDRPKADNRKVLRPYSNDMRRLLDGAAFNRGKRPSGFDVGKTAFANDNGGSIAHNFFETESLSAHREPRLPNAFAFANTGSQDHYTRTCRDRKVDRHPARMPPGLAAFFVELLTDPGDLVLDPFAGSNTTGYVAELLGRRWTAIEADAAYAAHSKIRFEDPLLEEASALRAVS
jgi:hypothetical protein